MWLLLGIVTITILSIYFSERFDDDHPLTNTFMFIIVCGFLLIPSLIIFLVLEHYDVVQEYKIFPITLPLFLIAGVVLWADRSKTKNNSSNDTPNKKDNFTAEAIIMTAVLSNDEKSDSSSGSSNSNSDDFFIL